MIALNVVIYLVTVAQGTGINNPGGGLFFDWVLFGPAIADGGWWRLLTSAFLHGSLIHIAMNMFVLYIVGSAVESTSARFATSGSTSSPASPAPRVRSS